MFLMSVLHAVSHHNLTLSGSVCPKAIIQMDDKYLILTNCPNPAFHGLRKVWRKRSCATVIRDEDSSSLVWTWSIVHLNGHLPFSLLIIYETSRHRQYSEMWKECLLYKLEWIILLSLWNQELNWESEIFFASKNIFQLITR
jgi:hypothetical protein